MYILLLLLFLPIKGLTVRNINKLIQKSNIYFSFISQSYVSICFFIIKIFLCSSCYLLNYVYNPVNIVCVQSFS